MRVCSLNVGLPRVVEWEGRAVRTAIFKEPVAGRLPIVGDNLAGDAQADLTVHGGRDKAVYAYPAEHYDFWRAELPGRDLPPGSFGENLTTEGLLESEVNVGDEFRVGSARLVVTQPRMPCYKLGLRFGDTGMVRRFARAERPGIYFAVVEEGDVAADDPIERTGRDPNDLSVLAMLRLMVAKQPGGPTLRRALAIPALAAVWRTAFAEQLRRLTP